MSTNFSDGIAPFYIQIHGLCLVACLSVKHRGRVILEPSKCLDTRHVVICVARFEGAKRMEAAVLFLDVLCIEALKTARFVEKVLSNVRPGLWYNRCSRGCQYDEVDVVKLVALYIYHDANAIAEYYGEDLNCYRRRQSIRAMRSYHPCRLARPDVAVSNTYARRACYGKRDVYTNMSALRDSRKLSSPQHVSFPWLVYCIHRH
eukprot:scaffold51355_cov32-Prasinocladus_malaysianus.AAC.1